MSPEEIRVLLAAAPELAKVLNTTISSISEVGKSLEDTKRHRWSVLQAISANDSLTGDQLLEAMRIVAEIEEKEKIDWVTIAASVTAGLGFVALGIWGAVKILGREAGKTVVNRTLGGA